MFPRQGALYIMRPVAWRESDGGKRLFCASLLVCRYILAM